MIPVMTNKQKETMHLAILHCYREMYAIANPPASYDELAEKNEPNFFWNHVLSEKEQERIIEQAIIDFKIPEKHRNVLYSNVYLGCSPMFNEK